MLNAYGNAMFMVSSSNQVR